MPVTKLAPALSVEQKRYAVESGIPIAPRKADGMDYPFLNMEVGDSFELRSESHREWTNVRGAISYWNKAHAPMKFALRLDRSSKKYRCWRIA